MSTETSPDGHGSAADGQARKGMMGGSSQSSGNANWEEFFQQHGWIDQDKIHCPDELIFEMRFVDGFSLVVYPASRAEESEVAPHITHGVLTFKNGTDHFYYPWSMLASLVTKLNPRRTNKNVGRDYAVDHGRERRLQNTDDLVIQPTAPERPKTVVGQTVAPGVEGPGGRQHSAVDPTAPSWSAGGKESDE
ncbi:MAG: hypothetical protein QOJ65_961 [Fimbriimonadaceae bacterium]|jgi:hypothetical protein|nr:hypothetical protein [Fimbriimonadaceae bacterium]